MMPMRALLCVYDITCDRYCRVNLGYDNVISRNFDSSRAPPASALVDSYQWPSAVA